VLDVPILLRSMAAGTDGMGAALSEPGGGRNMVVGGATTADVEGVAVSWWAAAPSLSEEA